MRQRVQVPEAEQPDAREASPADRSPVAEILDLQRTHGNAAVARLLARQPVDAGVPPPAGVPDRSVDDIPPPRAGDKADMDRAILDYMVAGHWANAVQVLNGFAQAEIDDRVKGYVPESRDGIIGAAATLGKDAERVRAPAQIEKALRGPRPDYYDLTHALQHYPDAARLPLRIAELDGKALAYVLRWAQAGSLPLAGALAPWLAVHAAEISGLAGTALSGRQYWDATILLNATTDADLETRLKPLTPADLYELKVAADNQKIARIVAVLGVEPRASVIKTEELDRTLTGEAAIERWAGVDAALQRYHNDAERNVRLGRLTVPQLVGLVLHLRAGTGVAATTPTGRLVEAALRPRLDALYASQVAAGNWGPIAWLLRGYVDADVLAKARAVMTAHRVPGVESCERMANAMFGNAHLVSRVLRFLQMESQTGASARPAGTQAMTMGPAAGGAVAVPGGSVTAYEQVAHPVTGERRWFSFSYQGADADKTGWLQFVSRECEMFDGRGNSAGFETSIETEATNQPGKRKWSSDKARYWDLDTAGDLQPFYEATSSAGNYFASTTSPTKTEIYDRPAFARVVTNAAFDEDLDEDVHPGGNVASVVLRMRFHDYLVRGMDVLYENTMTTEFRLASKTGNPIRKNTAGAGGAASKLRAEHHEALVRRFPAWTFYAR
jgi:hypothetical protein